MAKNEKTSKTVAAIAGALTAKQIDRAITAMNDLKLATSMRADFAISVLEQCKAVASSALSQAPDKKKTVKRLR